MAQTSSVLAAGGDFMLQQMHDLVPQITQRLREQDQELEFLRNQSNRYAQAIGELESLRNQNAMMDRRLREHNSELELLRNNNAQFHNANGGYRVPTVGPGGQATTCATPAMDPRIRVDTPTKAIPVQRDGFFMYGSQYKGAMQRNMGFPVVGAKLVTVPIQNSSNETYGDLECRSAQDRLKQAIDESVKNGKMSARLVQRDALAYNLNNVCHFSCTKFLAQLRDRGNNVQLWQLPSEFGPLANYYRNDPGMVACRMRAMRRVQLANLELLIMGAKDPMITSAVFAYQENSYPLNKSAALIANYQDYDVVAWDPSNGHVELKMVGACCMEPDSVVDNNYPITPDINRKPANQRPNVHSEEFKANISFGTNYDLVRKIVNVLLADRGGDIEQVAPKLQGEIVLWRGLSSAFDKVLETPNGGTTTTNVLVSSTVDVGVALEFANFNGQFKDKTSGLTHRTLLAIHLQDGLEVPVIVPGNLKRDYNEELEIVLPPGLMVKRIGNTVTSIMQNEVNLIYCTVVLE